MAFHPVSLCFPVDFVVGLNAKSLLPGETHGLLDQGKLESALGRPMHTYDGAPMYPSVVGKAGSLVEAIAQSHSFVDGNKRTGWMCMVLYLAQHGYRLRDMDAEASGSKVTDLVEHKIDLGQMTLWIASMLN